MRLRNHTTLAIGLALVIAAPLRAQRLVDVTVDLLDRLLRAHSTEQTEMDKVDPQLKAVDDKIAKFRDCKAAFEAAGNASGSAAGGLAARLAMRAKCGASSEDDIQKEKTNILAGPQNAAAKAGNFKVADYVSLRDKVLGYLHGDRSGFTPGALTLLGQRESDLSSSFGVAVASAPSTSGSVASGGAGVRMPGMWTTDYAWTYIGQLFALQYLSGATMFEKAYTPGQWTKWQMAEADEPDQQETMERAFLGTTADGGQWWRLKTTTSRKGDNNATVVDTVTLEALFKPQGDQVQQLVRMRGKLPGNADPQELIVPQAMSMLSMSAAFPFRPTPESIDGATVGTETVGGFSAKHVQFGSGNGTLNWWTADNAPGGWVKFSAIDASKKETYRMEMAGQGTGAKSELGIAGM